MVLGLTADPEEDLPRVKEYVAKQEAKHTIIWDEFDESGALFDVEAIPVTILIDKQGRIAEWHHKGEDGKPEFRHSGFRKGDEKVLEARIKELLAEG